MEYKIKKKKVSELPQLDNLTPESIIMVIDGGKNYKINAYSNLYVT